MKNVALVGYLRSGKDSVADHLVKQHGYSKISFAAALKDEVCRMLNSATVRRSDEVEAMWNPARLESEKVRMRPLLQWWGTEFRRADDPEYWVRQVERTIQNYTLASVSNGLEPRLVCTDARFNNEIEMLRFHEFTVVHLDMPVRELRSYLIEQGMTDHEVTRTLSHPSELEWQLAEKDAKFPSHFGNLPELRANVTRFLELEDK